MEDPVVAPDSFLVRTLKKERVVHEPKPQLIDNVVTVPHYQCIDRVKEVPCPQRVVRWVKTPKPTIIPRVVEIPKPVITEQIVEVPEIKLVEKVVEVPVYVYEENVVHVPKIITKERVIPIPKKIIEEKLVEITMSDDEDDNKMKPSFGTPVFKQFKKSHCHHHRHSPPPEMDDATNVVVQTHPSPPSSIESFSNSRPQRCHRDEPHKRHCHHGHRHHRCKKPFPDTTQITVSEGPPAPPRCAFVAPENYLSRVPQDPCPLTQILSDVFARIAGCSDNNNGQRFS